MTRTRARDMERQIRESRPKCSTDGCREQAWVVVQGTLADFQAEMENDHFCLRHKTPERVPSAERTHIEKTLIVVRRGEPWRNGEVWAVPVDDVTGKEHTSFEHGPGYLFYADELPVGSRITFSVDVELPGPDIPGAL